MADSKLLEQLHDIQLPKPVEWWPLAPGWYILLIGMLAFCTILAVWIYRRHVRLRPKKEALQLLDDIEKEYQREANSQQSSMKISELLRRVALVYFPRRHVASLQGNDWLIFLKETSKKINFNQMDYFLLQLPYQKSTAVDLKPLFICAKAWIKQRGAPCLN